MALVLEINVGEGFYVDDTRVTVEKIYASNRFQVMVHGPISKLLEIGNKVQTEIIPGVYCQAGRDEEDFFEDEYPTFCKIAITAPLQKRILREKFYKKEAINS